MLRLIFAFLCAAAACLLVSGALSSAQSTSSSTPDAFLAQVTNATGNAFATDMSANGRFVVFESSTDVATLKPGQTAATKSPTNTDGNTEIFLYDYAQRRIFQLTDTKPVLNPSPSPTASPSPSPSPSPSVSPTATPTPTATPIPFSNIKIDIQNKRPMISADPALSGGSRTYTIVFSSNAPNPRLFDGTDPGPIAADGGRTLAQDANEELWTYRFTVPEVADLSQGADIPFQDLSTGTFTRITSTAASRPPTEGSTSKAPFVADDNRDAVISDDGQIIAFSSTRDLVAGGNVDTGVAPNPEIFTFTRGTGLFTQVTNTKTSSNPLVAATFNDYPTIGGSGSLYTIAFYSNADLTPTASPNNSDLNSEVFVVSFNGATTANLRQVTRTKDLIETTSNGTRQKPANNFVWGRRISRDGRYVALESLATDPKANSATNSEFLVTFVYDTVADAFAQVGPRATATPGDVTHYPTFTDYTGSTPATVTFTSGLNIKSDGTLLAEGDNTGLNPATVSQVFAVPLTFPSMTGGPFTRLTNITGTNVLAPVNALTSNTRRRVVFSMGGADLGGGNPDFGAEVFYNLSPANTSESAGTISLLTGASFIPVAPASPTPSGSPTPSPSPTPAGSPATGPLVATGLAAGELSVLNATVSLAPSAAMTVNASVTQFGPALPVELKGVSVAIRGAAAGIYSVSPTAVSFVVPIGLTPGTYPLVINNNGTVIRGNITIVAAQPDVFTSTNGPGGRASICNITDPMVPGCVPEPFNVTTAPSPGGSPVATVLEVHATGVRGTSPAAISVVIGTTSITPTANRANDQPGFDNIIITLPSTVDRGDNLPVVVKVGAATSRPTPGDSPPLVKINP
jgi:uncharacterized protein (TIGR03437 family)